MTKTWPTDNLLDDMANEYAELLYNRWNFTKYGVKNPWAFRLAVKDALVVTDVGDVYLDPSLLVEAVDYYMGNTAREKENCLSEDEPAVTNSVIRMSAVESFVEETIDNRCYSDEMLEKLSDTTIRERIKTWMLEAIRNTANDLIDDAISDSLN